MLSDLIDLAVAQRLTAERSGLIRDYGQANATMGKLKAQARKLEGEVMDLRLNDLFNLLFLPF
jgi:hypothetical protein